MKSKLFIPSLLPFLFGLILIGCGTSTNTLYKLNLDMTKAEVVNTMGEPDAARGSMRNKFGQVVDVWEYKLTTKPLWGPWESSYYWLYFFDGKLVQWGKAGDWQREADRIYEMRFR